jgi:abequosyltransferase
MAETVLNEAREIAASASGRPSEDVLTFFGAALTKAKTAWMRLTYPFAQFGSRVSIHHSCEIRRPFCSRIKIGDSVYIAADSWLNIPEFVPGAPPAIILESGCKIGRRCMISAKRSVHLGSDVMLGPSVVITDHSHQFSNPDSPIHAQGLTEGGRVYIGKNCWLGHGAAIICTAGELVVGRNSVVGANAVVTRSVPPFSVVAGSPARVVKRYAPEVGKWVTERPS